MRIGIDIDDVITDTSITIKDYIEKNDPSGEIKKYIVDIMNGEPPAFIKDFVDENGLKFFQKTTIKHDAIRVINKLYDSGNEIYIITARGDKSFKGSEKFTLDFLKNNNIKFTKIFFNSYEKAKICKDNDVEIMIDDSVKHCTEIFKENIKSILFTSMINKNIDIEIPRVNDWLELEKIFVKEIL